MPALGCGSRKTTKTELSLAILSVLGQPGIEEALSVSEGIYEQEDQGFKFSRMFFAPTLRPLSAGWSRSLQAPSSRSLSLATRDSSIWHHLPNLQIPPPPSS